MSHVGQCGAVQKRTFNFSLSRGKEASRFLSAKFSYWKRKSEGEGQTERDSRGGGRERARENVHKKMATQKWRRNHRLVSQLASLPFNCQFLFLKYNSVKFTPMYCNLSIDTVVKRTSCCQVVQEYERAVIFRLGRLLAGGSRGPGEQSCAWRLLFKANARQRKWGPLMFSEGGGGWVSTVVITKE